MDHGGDAGVGVGFVGEGEAPGDAVGGPVTDGQLIAEGLGDSGVDNGVQGMDGRVWQALDVLEGLVGQHVRRRGCGKVQLRHGSRHDVYLNPANGNKQPVPRHSEIDEQLARHIRKYLGV